MNTDTNYVLVTGGAGFIGSHTILSLIKTGFHPIILDDFRNSQNDVIERLEALTQTKIITFPYACQDKGRIRAIFEKYPLSGVIHFAGYKAVSQSVAYPLEYLSNNIVSLITILEFVKEYNIPKFVFSSSCTVYGNPSQCPVDESYPTTYLTPYGYSKKSGEDILTQFVAKNVDTHVTILRYFNPIGADESGLIGEEPKGIPNNLLPYITQTVIGLQKELVIFGNDFPTPDGTCIRDYIHVVDLAAAHLCAFKEENKGTNPTFYNVGNGNGTSVLELVHAFEKCTGKQVPFRFGARRDGDIAAIYAKVEKIKHELGWEAQYSLEDAIKSAWKFEQFIRTKRN